jgi:hypothetical protein
MVMPEMFIAVVRFVYGGAAKPWWAFTTGRKQRQT